MYRLYLFGILAIGTAVLIVYTQPLVEGWDPVAYLYAGRRLAQGELPKVCSHLNAEIGPYFTLAGFNIHIEKYGQECLFLNYPPGFPALLAVAQKVIGKPEAALYISAVLGGLGLLFTFSTGTLLFDNPAVGLIGAFLLICAPTFLQFSTSPWSDGPGMALLMGGVTAIVMGGRSKTPLGKTVMGMAGALFMGWSIFTRYVNAVAILPLMMYLIFKYKDTILREQSVISFAIGAVGMVLGVALFNRVYYGSYFSTSYTPAHGWYDWPAFNLHYAFGASPVGGKSLLGTIQTLAANYSWLLFLAGIGCVRMPPPERVLVLGSILVFIALYGFYAFAPVGINARFLLPVFPFIGISVGYALIDMAPNKRRQWWYRIGWVVIAVTMLISLPGHLQGLASRNAEAASYVGKIIRLTENTEPNAIFLAYNANDAIMYYGERTTMFYRRMIGTNSGDFEHTLITACEALLKKQLPIYLVMDSNPPFGNSLEILQRYFDLLPLNTDPPLYRIQPRN